VRKSRTTVITCEQCGTTKRRPNSAIYNHTFCGRACLAEWNRVHRHGPTSARWKGGRSLTRGYVRLFTPGHPAADPNGYVLEHRLVAEQTLGRFLLPTEVVHHRDDNRQNNHPDNLQVMSNAAHTAHHLNLNGRWARRYPCCIGCGTTQRRHEAHGLCVNCYQRGRQSRG
jgi:hypothetical protein